ncbi:hypothetical protein [Microvirga sp. 2TAF3]|uniref:hypothetical protein n=1 Tax=Microvirga sp. 2TAF3 TaxID=3233014 RepID=UPI003F9A6DCF
MTKAFHLIGALAFSLGLAACNSVGDGGAAGTALAIGTSFDPTGLSGTAVRLATPAIAAASTAAANADVDTGSGPDLSRFLPRLRDVASGKTARPHFADDAASVMDRDNARMTMNQLKSMASVMRGLASGAMSGGLGAADAAARIGQQALWGGIRTAEQQAATAYTKGALKNAQSQFASDRTVPDADRPAEARVILSIADDADGQTASWKNPATGASGTVSIQSIEMAEASEYRCRIVMRSWKGSSMRTGSMGICQYQGDWYELF